MDLLKLSPGLCFSRFGCIFKCFDVGRHRLLHVFGRPFLGIVWVGNRYPAPQTPWTARCNFFGYSLQIKQVYDTLAFWCAASVWNYYILWYIGLLVLLGFKKPWLEWNQQKPSNHLQARQASLQWQRSECLQCMWDRWWHLLDQSRDCNYSIYYMLNIHLHIFDCDVRQVTKVYIQDGFFPLCTLLFVPRWLPGFLSSWPSPILLRTFRNELDCREAKKFHHLTTPIWVFPKILVPPNHQFQ